MNIISRTSVLNISEFLDDVSIIKLHDTNKYNSFVLNEKVINIKRDYANQIIRKLIKIKKRVDKIFNQHLNTKLALYDKNNDKIAQIYISFRYVMGGIISGIPSYYIRIYLGNAPGWKNHKKIKEGYTNKRKMKQLLLKYMNSGFTLLPIHGYDNWHYTYNSNFESRVWEEKERTREFHLRKSYAYRRCSLPRMGHFHSLQARRPLLNYYNSEYY